MRKRNTGVSIFGAIVSVMVIAQGATAATGPRYNITGVEAEQLSNAVQIKVVSNGNISFNMDKWSDGKSYTGFTEPGSDGVMAARAIAMNVPNATSSVGDYVYIGKYPVSHVELSAPPEREIRRGSEVGHSLDVIICLYTGARMRTVDGESWSLEASANQLVDAAQVFDVALSQDRRSIIITVTRDQQIQPVMRRSSRDVPDSQRELNISYEDGQLELHARNVELTQLMSAVTELTGRRIQVDPDTHRLVSAELKRIAVDDLLQRISECYGLEANNNDGVVMMSDVLNRTTGSFTSSQTYRLPVRNIRAEDARELLPTFLMEYTSVDKGNNELIVSGSRDLANKVSRDLRTLDQRPPTISMKIRLIELTSGAGLEESLNAEFANKDSLSSLDTSAGRLRFSKLDVQPDELEVRLEWLVSNEKAVVHSEAHISTLNGRTGQVFAGESKYIAVMDLYGDGRAIPVSSGTRLKITPRAGEDSITLSINAEMKEIESTDAVTNLPTVSTRSVDGSYRIRSGETLLVGGLSQMQPNTSLRRIPVLGRLPIIGGLFRGKSTQHTSSELVILITPTIM